MSSTTKFERPDIADVTAAIDNLVCAEEYFFKAGIEAGQSQGVKMGKMQGASIGYAKGNEIGSEIGYYRGSVHTWHLLQKIFSEKYNQRCRDATDKLHRALQSWGKEGIDAQDEGLPEAMEVIRSRYKMAASHMGVSTTGNAGNNSFSF